MAEFQIPAARGDMTALQNRDFLSGEFTPRPPAALRATLKTREAAGLLKLQKK